MSAAILLVEDDEDLVRGLRFNLAAEGYAVRHAGDAASALAALAAEPPDLVVLDLNLPDGDGIDVLRALRRRDTELPVLCLTARGEETDVVMGLGAGADDYVTKPFGLAELLARIAALLRRSARADDARLVQLGEATVDLAARKVSHKDREEPLTPIEAELLAYLLRHRGEAVERERMLREIWGARGGTTRTLDNHISRLRKKLEADPARPSFLVTVHGTGYRLERGGTGS